jgi:hypothetical protein
MPKMNLDVADALSVVTRRTYFYERESRLYGEDLCESSRYKMRLQPTVQTAAKYAVDFLCEVQGIEFASNTGGYGVLIELVDNHGRIKTADYDIVLALGFNGIILATQDDGEAVPNSETGYLLSSIADSPLSLLNIPEAEENPVTIPSPVNAPLHSFTNT